MKLTRIYTYWTTLGGALSEPMLLVSHHDSNNKEHIGKQEHVVDIDVIEPSKAEVVQEVIGALRKQQQECRAEIAKIEDKISSLLCLEHKEVA